MDRKSIIVLVVCFLLMFSMPYLGNKLFPPKQLPPGRTNSVAESQFTTNRSNTSALAPAVSEMPGTVTSTVNTNIPEQFLEITNADAHYMLTSYRSGLKLIELLHYPESISTRRDERSHTNRVATLNTFTPNANPALAILDGTAVQGDGIFTLTRTVNGVRAEKTLTNGLTLIKEFAISTNYLLFATVRFE